MKHVNFPSIDIASKKYIEITWSSSINVTSRKIHRDDVDFSPIAIKSNKACRNDIDFSLIEITSKKFVKTT